MNAVLWIWCWCWGCKIRPPSTIPPTPIPTTQSTLVPVTTTDSITAQPTKEKTTSFSPPKTPLFNPTARNPITLQPTNIPTADPATTVQPTINPKISPPHTNPTKKPTPLSSQSVEPKFSSNPTLNPSNQPAPFLKSSSALPSTTYVPTINCVDNEDITKTPPTTPPVTSNENGIFGTVTSNSRTLVYNYEMTLVPDLSKEIIQNNILRDLEEFMVQNLANAFLFSPGGTNEESIESNNRQNDTKNKTRVAKCLFHNNRNRLKTNGTNLLLSDAKPLENEEGLLEEITSRPLQNGIGQGLRRILLRRRLLVIFGMDANPNDRIGDDQCTQGASSNCIPITGGLGMYFLESATDEEITAASQSISQRIKNSMVSNDYLSANFNITDIVFISSELSKNGKTEDENAGMAIQNQNEQLGNNFLFIAIGVSGALIAAILLLALRRRNLKDDKDEEDGMLNKDIENLHHSRKMVDTTLMQGNTINPTSSDVITVASSSVGNNSPSNDITRGAMLGQMIDDEVSVMNDDELLFNPPGKNSSFQRNTLYKVDGSVLDQRILKKDDTEKREEEKAKNDGVGGGVAVAMGSSGFGKPANDENALEDPFVTDEDNALFSIVSDNNQDDNDRSNDRSNEVLVTSSTAAATNAAAVSSTSATISVLTTLICHDENRIQQHQESHKHFEKKDIHRASSTNNRIQDQEKENEMECVDGIFDCTKDNSTNTEYQDENALPMNQGVRFGDNKKSTALLDPSSLQIITKTNNEANNNNDVDNANSNAPITDSEIADTSMLSQTNDPSPKSFDQASTHPLSATSISLDSGKNKNRSNIMLWSTPGEHNDELINDDSMVVDTNLTPVRTNGRKQLITKTASGNNSKAEFYSSRNEGGSGVVGNISDFEV